MSTILHHLRQKTFLSMVSRLHYGSIDLTMPDGTTHSYKGVAPGPHADMTIVSEAGLKQMMLNGKMGFCEAYMEGHITSDRLANLVELTVMHNDFVEQEMDMGFLRNIVQKWQHWRNQNSKSGSARNIAYHYDLGNQFYETWLDQSMTYSSAIFAEQDEKLETAQQRKYAYLCDLADIQPGDKVLEIGCGWGGFAEYAATHRQAHVTGVTISNAQFDYATDRMKKQGIEDKTSIQLTDYRDIDGRFDKIVSIEMFEAVGMQYWPVFFGKLSQSLKSGGSAALQLITIEQKSFDSYVRQPDFIQRYIFPGGMLPSIEALDNPISTAQMKMTENNGYAHDYAHTLRRWRERFLSAWDNELQFGKFDQRFKRMWELYLAYCEGGFTAGMIDVNQIVLKPKL